MKLYRAICDLRVHAGGNIYRDNVTVGVYTDREKAEKEARKFANDIEKSLGTTVQSANPYSLELSLDEADWTAQAWITEMELDIFVKP